MYMYACEKRIECQLALPFRLQSLCWIEKNSKMMITDCFEWGFPPVIWPTKDPFSFLSSILWRWGHFRLFDSRSLLWSRRLGWGADWHWASQLQMNEATLMLATLVACLSGLYLHFFCFYSRLKNYFCETLLKGTCWILLGMKVWMDKNLMIFKTDEAKWKMKLFIASLFNSVTPSEEKILW